MTESRHTHTHTQSQLSSGKYLQYIHFKSRITIMIWSLHMKHRHGLCHFVTTNNPLPVERLGQLISDLSMYMLACMLDEPRFSWSADIKTEGAQGWMRWFGTGCINSFFLPQLSSALNVIREDTHTSKFTPQQPLSRHKFFLTTK